MKNPIRLDKLLNTGNHELASLITRARQFAAYNRWLQQHLSAPLNNKCAIADIHGNVLVVSVDNAIWATKLRFSASSVIPQLKLQFPELAELEEMKVIILPIGTQPPKEPVTWPKPHLSTKNANGIRVLAESIRDPQLRQALERLARHERKE